MKRPAGIQAWNVSDNIWISSIATASSGWKPPWGSSHRQAVAIYVIRFQDDGSSWYVEQWWCHQLGAGCYRSHLQLPAMSSALVHGNIWTSIHQWCSPPGFLDKQHRTPLLEIAGSCHARTELHPWPEKQFKAWSIIQYYQYYHQYHHPNSSNMIQYHIIHIIHKS